MNLIKSQVKLLQTEATLARALAERDDIIEALTRQLDQMATTIDKLQKQNGNQVKKEDICQ